MDRPIVYPGAIPLDTDLLNTNRNVMKAVGMLAQAVIGTNTIVSGLAVGPNSPTAMNVVVGPGSIFQVSTVDATAYGSLPADTADALVKQGINIASTTLAIAAPGTSGYSQNYLIEAALLEADGTPVVLPYYNASNPSAPYLGPGNSGTAQNTVRAQTVQLQAKAGVPATTGTQTTPAVDAGWVGLAVVTVAYGAASITRANISAYPGAPVIPYTLPQLGALYTPSLPAKPFYDATATQTATTANNTSYTLQSQTVVLPSQGLTSGFRLDIKAILQGISTATLSQHVTFTVTDGTTSVVGGEWLVQSSTSSQVVAVAEDFFFPTIYAPGAAPTITLQFATTGSAGLSGQIALSSSRLTIRVVDA